MSNEEDHKNWIVLKDYPSYSINQEGEILNNKRNKLLKPWINKGGYEQVTLRLDGKRYAPYIHKLVAETFFDPVEYKKIIDHINGDKLNNSVSNLRYCTQRENCMNSKKREGTSSKYKGVSYCKKNNKYQSYITIDGVLVHLGFYTDEEAAREVRVKKVHEIFGDYAHSSEK
jgi:hypothetical protein